jgi:hypothetical protein
LRLYERLGFERVKDDGIYWLMEWSLPGDEGGAVGLGRRSR